MTPNGNSQTWHSEYTVHRHFMLHSFTMAQLKFFTSPVTSHQQNEQRVIRGGIQKLKKGEKEKDRRRRERERKERWRQRKRDGGPQVILSCVKTRNSLNSKDALMTSPHTTSSPIFNLKLFKHGNCTTALSSPPSSPFFPPVAPLPLRLGALSCGYKWKKKVFSIQNAR